MDILVGDFETYYLRGQYSLSSRGKNAMTTQEYIEDKRYQTILFGYKLNNNPTKYFTANSEAEFKQKLQKLADWRNTIFVAHNAQFDAGILSLRFGIKPAYVFCTMAMAQTLGIQKLAGGASLDKLSRWFRRLGHNLPPKGTEVDNANGLRREDFTPEHMARYGGYCMDDVRITRALFDLMRKKLPKKEMLFHSITNKAFTEPVLVLDKSMLELELERVKKEKRDIQQKIANKLGVTLDDLGKTLRSADKFAELLREHRVDPPRKISKRTNKETYAFAKNDKGFMALLEHKDPFVVALAEAKQGASSNIQESRIERLIRLADMPSGKLCMPIKISGAHTLRASGSDGINVQNFPSGRVPGQSKAVRRAIMAPEGSVLAAPDSGQIEARVLSFEANDKKTMGIFARGECPYSDMAETIYHVPAHEVKAGDKAYKGGDEQAKKFYLMRQIGKATILQLGYQAGWKSFLEQLRYTYGVLEATEQEAKTIVDTYRATKREVVAFWDVADNVLKAMVAGKRGYFGGPSGKLFYFDGQHDWFGAKVPSVRLPNGTWLTYPRLQIIDKGERGWPEIFYIPDIQKFHRNKSSYETHYEALLKLGKKIYGGAFTENLTQALAFAALKDQAVDMSAFAKFCFNVHDEHIIVDRKDAMPDTAKRAQAAMMVVPDYIRGCKFDCEYSISRRYGDC